MTSGRLVSANRSRTGELATVARRAAGEGSGAYDTTNLHRSTDERESSAVTVVPFGWTPGHGGGPPETLPLVKAAVMPFRIV
ncbi:hypothetical protein GCM10009765_56920 [Fodinicola feengrottensis]|uniref:Uncharacterized protein n=1 Tax=Fodinicola feengrottensis TaxID=435914 RepID=A0ABN2I7R6_9ACTN